MSNFEQQVQVNVKTRCPNRYLELSLPKFSLTALTDLKALLNVMDLDTLMGADAQFQRLSNKEKFTVDQV